jgi:hypothetical protein
MEMECYNFYTDLWSRYKYKGNRGQKIPKLVQAKCFNCPVNVNCFCFQTFLTRERLCDMWTEPYWKKESVFLSLSEGKHFPLIKRL